jgi:hypothetical protein
MLAISARYSIGDPIVAAATEFGQFRVWGAENEINVVQGDVPVISIISPVENSVYYCDENVSIAGRVTPGAGRKSSAVFYRVNRGEWERANLAGGGWSVPPQQYSHGMYMVEAIAFDDNGGESARPAVNFTSLFRYIPDARLVADNIPDTMAAGDVYHCTIAFENTGNIAWNLSQGYRLSPYSSTAFGSSSYEVPGHGVQPGGTCSFGVTLVAPATPGQYDVSFRMSGGGYGWFGDEMRMPISVVAAVYDSKVVSIDMPSQMTQGDTYLATIVMQNTGNGAWYPGVAKLGMVGGSGGDACRMAGADSISLSSEVKPGETCSFKVNAAALAPGVYYPEFRMNHVTKGWFGETAGATVRVVARATPTPRPTSERPYVSYVAYGKFVLYDTSNRQITGGPFGWAYDGPFGRGNQRSSYFSEPWWPHPDWDIGGPNGQYHVYKDGCTGSGTFSMNNGGEKGTIVFHMIN